MSKKILAVYNACGISGKENSENYINSIKLILSQKFESFDVVFSSCLNNQSSRNNVRNYFGNSIKYNFINEALPVNVTFNHSVEKNIQNNGKYEGYLYIDSGTSFTKEDLFQSLYERLKVGKYGMVSAHSSNDTEFFNGLGVGRFNGDDKYAREILFKNGDYIVPVGKAFATHTNLISEDLRSFYGKVYPDIFASHCTESTFSFLNAALKKQWILLKDFVIPHHISMDGQSSGFSPLKWAMSGNRLYDHPFKIKSILSRVQTSEAAKSGFGYEECNNILIHDKLQFDGNHLCINDNLKGFIKNNIFLKEEEFNYNSIKHEFIN